MINYSILNTLYGKELTKTTPVLQKKGFIKSKVLVQYEEGWNTLSEVGFEHILHKEIGKMPSDDDDMIASWIIHNEQEVEYQIIMPVEMFPYYMNVVGMCMDGWYDGLKIKEIDLAYQWWWEEQGNDSNNC